MQSIVFCVFRCMCSHQYASFEIFVGNSRSHRKLYIIYTITFCVIMLFLALSPMISANEGYINPNE